MALPELRTELTDGLETLALRGRLTLGRNDAGQWELFVLRHDTADTMTFRGPSVVAVVAEALRWSEENGWLPHPKG